MNVDILRHAIEQVSPDREDAIRVAVWQAFASGQLHESEVCDLTERLEARKRPIIVKLDSQPSRSKMGQSADWMAGAPRVSRYRRELAESIRDQADGGGDVYLGPTDSLIAADALDGFNDIDDE